MKISVLVQETSESQKTKLKSVGLPTLKVMFTNADQMTAPKMVELKEQIEVEKPNWRDKGRYPVNADTREAIKNKNNAFRAWMAAITGFDKDAARAVYEKARNKSKTLLGKSKRLFEMGIAQ